VRVTSPTPGAAEKPSPPESLGDGAGIEVLSPEDVLGIGLGEDILIVDDHTTNLVAYEAALAPLGRRLVLVESGVEALAKLLDQDFALVLLDVSMPGMNGLETARMIRGRPRSKTTPIIFITGMSAPADVILEAYEVGAFDFVIKPIPPEVLRAKARVYLLLQERTKEMLHHAKRLREANRLLRESESIAATARRLEKLQEATQALSEARTAAEVAAVAVRLGAEAVEASAAVMWSARLDGSFVVQASHQVPDGYLDNFRVIPADAPHPITRVAQRREAIWVENAADYAREAPSTIEQARAAGRVWAFVTLPLVGNHRTTAVLTFSYASDHTFTDEERRFLAALVHACEQALERGQLFIAEAEARRSAEELSRRKDEFLAMLSHELRNPLAAMIAALDLIKMRGQTLGRELGVLDRQSRHLVEIVDDLVDVSRITRGMISLRRDAVPLEEAVAHAMDMARPLIDQRAHDVSLHIPQNVHLDADRGRLGQVLANLLVNAAKYTPAKGRIEVTADLDGSFVQIVVRDNGRGIPPALLPILFDVFVQGERSPARSEGGLGIGLALVRTLAELHGGTVEAHSDGPGTGSTFTLRWPKAPDKTPTQAPARTAPQTGRSLRVLVVDDNVDAAELLAALLTSTGYELAVANDAKLALTMAADFRPDVALLDIGLPVIDGYMLAEQLRLVPGCANTLLVAVTGYGQPEDRERSRRAGFAHHLVKPVPIDALQSLLQAAADEQTT
jgi:signal transduction histidine kinase/PleD family two-component response regulator